MTRNLGAPADGSDAAGGQGRAPGRVVCFGEVLLRLSAPAGEMLLQSPRLEARVGGAEANVAVSLARFGHPVSMVTILPDNALGRSARDELRRHGVDTAGVRFAPGRMGLYFLTPGAVLRPSEVLYDRAGSAFAAAAPDLIDWDRELAGAGWLHLSGVTPALGPGAGQAAARAAEAAERLGVRVSFDGNHRAKLWAAWGGDPRAGIRPVLERAELAFIDDRDLALLLERTFEGDRDTRRRAAADAAFEAFPRVRRIASTTRDQTAADRHTLGAGLYTRDGVCSAPALELTGVVDRIGGGDAFAAGVLHGLLRDMDDEAALRFGLAAGALKHSIAGDFNLVDEAEVTRLLADGSQAVRR